MEIEEPFKLGFLFTPPQSFLRKSWVKRFCALYNASSHGIQRLEIFDNDAAFLKQSKSPSKIIPLTDCVKVTPSPQKQQANVFEVCTKSCSHQFSADSFQEMTEWLSALQSVAFNLVNVGVGIAQYNMQEVKQEENLLYSSMDEPEIYSVKSLNTEAMIRNNLYGDYKLIITAVSISIAEDKLPNKVGKAVLTWPYRHIRRYGCSKDNFSFEAGRKCASGEGLFAFSSPDGSVIFQSLDAHVASLKLSQSDNENPSSPACDSDKNSIFIFKEESKAKSDEAVLDGIIAPKKMLSEKGFKNRNDKCQIDNSSKPMQPISKPPRKSKANTYANVQKIENDTSPTLRVRSFTDRNMNLGANIYEEPVDHECPDVKQQTKTGEAINPHSLMYEPVYAVLEAEPANNSSVSVITDEVRNVCLIDDNSSNVEKNSDNSIKNHPNRESDSYDHLYLQKFDRSKILSRNSADHVYGKLLSNRSSSVSNSTFSNCHGSVKIMQKGPADGNFSESNHCYTNVKVKSPNKHPSSDSEPKHVLQNNAEYAKVNKSKKGEKNH